MNVRVSRQKLVRCLVWTTATFSALGILVEILSGNHESHGWLVLFDLDKEWNLPTIYSAFLLFASSALLLLIASERQRVQAPDSAHWVALAAIFCFFGFDELFSIHNSAKHLVPIWFKHIGLFNLRWDLRWIVVVIPIILVIVILFVPFVLRLPRPTACGIVISGMIYFGSALGVELIGGWWIGKHTRNNWTYSALVVVEETGEMAGALLFLSVLLAYTDREIGGRARLGSLVLELVAPP